MLNRTTSAKISAPEHPGIKIRNPKLEISNKPKHSNLKIEILNEIVWNFKYFDHSDLFRISNFEFRICNFIYTWRPLRLCESNLLSDCFEPLCFCHYYLFRISGFVLRFSFFPLLFLISCFQPFAPLPRTTERPVRKRGDDPVK